jgi:hypothetical protein
MIMNRDLLIQENQAESPKKEAGKVMMIWNQGNRVVRRLAKN